MATSGRQRKHSVVFADKDEGPSGHAVDELVSRASSTTMTARTASVLLAMEGGPRTIWEAAAAGQAGAITKLVERAVEFDINARDRNHRTALHWAAELGHVNCIETLIDYGCDVRLVECNGRTPMHLAAREVHADALAALFEPLSPEERVAHANFCDHVGMTPVFMSLQKAEPGNPAFNFLMQNGGRYSQGNVPRKQSQASASAASAPAPAPVQAAS